MAILAKTIYVRVGQDSDGETYLDASDRLEDVVDGDGATYTIGVYQFVERRRYRKAVQVVSA